MTNPNEHAETLQNFRALGLPLHMMQRFFPETVRAEIRAVERPGSSVLAGGRKLVVSEQEVKRMKAKARRPEPVVPKPPKPRRVPVGAEDVAKDVLRSCQTVCGIVNARKEIKKRYPNMKD